MTRIRLGTAATVALTSRNPVMDRVPMRLRLGVPARRYVAGLLDGGVDAVLFVGVGAHDVEEHGAHGT